MEALITDAGIILLQFKTSDVEKLLARLGCHLISMKFCCERWPWLYTPSFCEMWASFPHTDFHSLQRTVVQAINSSCSGDSTAHIPLECSSLYSPSHDQSQHPTKSLSTFRLFQTSGLVDKAQMAVAVCTWSATSAAGAAELHVEQLLCASWSHFLDQLVPTNWCHFTWLFRDWWGMGGSGAQAAPRRQRMIHGAKLENKK